MSPDLVSFLAFYLPGFVGCLVAGYAMLFGPWSYKASAQVWACAFVPVLNLGVLAWAIFDGLTYVLSLLARRLHGRRLNNPRKDER